MFCNARRGLSDSGGPAGSWGGDVLWSGDRTTADDSGLICIDGIRITFLVRANGNLFLLILKNCAPPLVPLPLTSASMT